MIRVRKDNPCPICGRSDWCLVAESGSAAICSRIEEGSVRKAGDAGWLHKLTPDQRPAKRYVAKPKKQAPPPDFYMLTQRYLMTVTGFDRLSKELGVSVSSLQRLQVGWKAKPIAYAFPMRDGGNRIVGIRLRLPSGKKFAVAGSKNALFWPVGVKADSKNLLFICEGPTDTAALLDLGFDAIGRASCNTGAGYIKTMIGKHNRQVVIVSDKDGPKDKPGGGVFYPGIEGARRLAADIKAVVRSVRVIKPPHNKDIREWYQSGATAAKVMILVDNARFL